MPDRTESICQHSELPQANSVLRRPWPQRYTAVRRMKPARATEQPGCIPPGGKYQKPIGASEQHRSHPRNANANYGQEGGPHGGGDQSGCD